MSREGKEISSAPPTPDNHVLHPESPSQYHSPSLSRSSLLNGESSSDGDDQRTNAITNAPKTPMTTPTPTRLSLSPKFISPLISPLREALRMTKLDPQDAWLPITESRNGNQYYAAFHTLCSGIGIQALVLPVAFTVLGWSWGIICLTLAFIWQLYTLWILVQLHESVETGLRYSRYLHLFSTSFGEKMTKLLAVFPILQLSGGTCVALIIVGGSTWKLFFQIACGPECAAELTTVEWYLAFTCVAAILSQLPNMNSIAGVSLVGGITAVGYCTIIWGVSVGKGRLEGVTYNPVRRGSQIEQVLSVLNAIGIIAFVFRGHNLILEIQATMPSSEKNPSHVPMWKGVKVAYSLIAACIFPLAIGGYWAYGHLIPTNIGMLGAMFQFHLHDASKFILGLTSFFVIVNSVSSFQIYGMPVLDQIESKYTSRAEKPIPWWIRALSRIIFVFGCFFMSVAIPFLDSLASLIGGSALPITLAYPCFMWLKIKKPKMFGPIWFLNWSLGLLGMSLSGLLIAAGIYDIIHTGVKVSFFKPH